MLPVWSCHPPLHPLARWLSSSGSLTVRLQAVGRFSVQPLAVGSARVTPDEARILRQGGGARVYVREVCLAVDGVPCVLARTVATPQAMRLAWRGLARLGRRSLGAVLLRHPQVQRGRLDYAHLRPAHTVYRRFACHLAGLPAGLPARRSCFVLRGQRLLVLEAFLPAARKFSPGPAIAGLRRARPIAHNDHE